MVLMSYADSAALNLEIWSYTVHIMSKGSVLLITLSHLSLVRFMEFKLMIKIAVFFFTSAF